MPPGVGSQHVAQDFESDATDTETRTLALGATGTLELKNVSGTIECVVAASVSGDVSVTGIRTAGGPGGRSVSGDVTVEAVQANRIDARSVSGAVGVTRAETAEASLGSTSGDVTYDGALAEQGRNEVRSHSGDARITLDAGTGSNCVSRRSADRSGQTRQSPPEGMAIRHAPFGQLSEMAAP